MTLKRLAAILLCLAMATVTLASSTQSGSIATTEPTGGSPTTEAGTTAPDPMGKYDETVTITVAGGLNSTMVFDENDPEKKSLAENRWINAYLEQLNVNVAYKWISTGDSATKWATAIASGDVPDAARIDSSIYKTLLDAGLIADMTDIYEKYASEDYKNLIPETNYQDLWFDGSLRGLPYTETSYMSSTLLFIRQDWLDSLGLKVPTSISDVVATAEAFKAAGLGGENTIGLMFSEGFTEYGEWDAFFNAYGAYLNIWLEKDGALVYSNTQDETKDALLAMQTLYTNDTMNKDFAVTNSSIAQEYISGGKTGIFYGTAWIVVTAIQALYDNDEAAKIINVYPPSTSDDAVALQTYYPPTGKIFVSTTCEDPEAVVKMVNLSIELYNSDPEHYFNDSEGFMWDRYLPFGDNPAVITYYLDTANAIREAEKTGVFETDNVVLKSTYANYKSALQGEASDWYYLMYGEGGSYTTLYDAYQDELLLIDAFRGLPTETMSLTGSIINDELWTAMLDVIMGADISVYEEAVANWYANGGQAITDEVNEWYQSRS